MDSHSWMLYISIVVLLAFSAFFSASEMALSAHNRIRLKKRAQDGDSDAKTALGLTEKYGSTLNAILVGNNLVNIAASSIAALIFTTALGSYGALVSTVVTTVLVLAFGEILPKSYANARSDDVVLKVAKPLRSLSVLLFPLTFLFGAFQNIFYRRVALGEKPPSITEEELMYFIESIEEEGVLEEQESNLVQSALEFDEITIREIVTPRVNLVSLDVDSDPRGIVQFLLESKHSRIPVYEGSIDNIIGILFVRDAMRRLVRGEEVSLRDMLEKPYFVHKGMKLSSLLTIFQSQKVRMAVVLDEYGGTIGIVTLVDLMEELVGDLYDGEGEYPEHFTRLDDDHLQITGGYGLWDMFEELGVGEDGQESDYSTVNGWALHIIGHIPEVGEFFDAEGMRFTVLEMDGHRIKLLEARRILPQPENVPSGEKAGL